MKHCAKKIVSITLVSFSIKAGWLNIMVSPYQFIIWLRGIAMSNIKIMLMGIVIMLLSGIFSILSVGDTWSDATIVGLVFLGVGLIVFLFGFFKKEK